MVSGKSLIMSLCLLLAVAASYYWFIKLAWINIINAISHSFGAEKRETMVRVFHHTHTKKNGTQLQSVVPYTVPG